LQSSLRVLLIQMPLHPHCFILAASLLLPVAPADSSAINALSLSAADATNPHRLLYEGQEEIGSPNLPSFLTSHAQGLLSGVDLVLNADGGQVSATQPGICTGKPSDIINLMTGP
jgi:hypothetical protein